MLTEDNDKLSELSGPAFTSCLKIRKSCNSLVGILADYTVRSEQDLFGEPELIKESSDSQMQFVVLLLSRAFDVPNSIEFCSRFLDS